MPRDAVDVLRWARTAQLVDEDGGPVELELAPPPSQEEIDEVAAGVAALLPRELTAVLAETSGVDGIEELDFTGRTMDVDVSELSPSGLPFAADGFGNFWLLDLTPADGETVPVFYLCHDPPVFVYQSPTLGEFLHELFRRYEPPHESLVEEVHERHAFDVWHTNRGELDHAAALVRDDELRAFAGELGETFSFVDLRSPEIGTGLSWGRYGPRTDIRRHGDARLFAYAPPEKNPGLLTRLFRT